MKVNLEYLAGLLDVFQASEKAHITIIDFIDSSMAGIIEEGDFQGNCINIER